MALIAIMTAGKCFFKWINQRIENIHIVANVLWNMIIENNITFSRGEYLTRYWNLLGVYSFDFSIIIQSIIYK